MATVNKNFRVKNGLIVEGGSATVNGFDVLTKAQADQDYIVSIIGGTATSANTANTVVKRDANGNFAAGTITATFTGNLTGNVTGDVTGNVSGQAGTVSSLSGHSSDEISEGSTNKYYTDERAQDAIGNSLGTGLSYNDTTGAISVTANTYDAYGAASAAQTAAATDATTKANAAQAAAEATAAADATTKANAAQAAAISAAATAANSALTSAISTEVSNRNTAISTAVDNLVAGAPNLLNTLDELAAAIADDANYATTMTSALATKAPLASPALTGVPTAPTAAANTDTTQIATTAFAKAEADAAQAAAEATAAADATTKANAAQSAATTAAATDATTKANAAQSAATTAAATDATTKANAAQAAAEATAASALTAVKNGTTKFTAVNVNDLVSQRAAQAVLASIATGSSVMSWAKSDYPTAKLWVKFATATHSQISEILLTTDSSNNIAITDFAETGTNGSLGTITASYVAGNIGIEVNTVYANTTVTVVATLIK
jgi:hypothetical protein